MSKSRLDELVSSYSTKLTKEEGAIDSNEKMILSDSKIHELIDEGYTYMEEPLGIEEILDKGNNREVFAEALKVLADTEGEEHY